MGVVDLPSSSYKRSASFRRHRDEQFSWSALLERHGFLLRMLLLLLVLCTIYLYFAITLTADSCSALSGAEKALCEATSSSLRKGKLRLL